MQREYRNDGGADVLRTMRHATVLSIFATIYVLSGFAAAVDERPAATWSKESTDRVSVSDQQY